MSAAESQSASDECAGGAPPRHIDFWTADLDRRARVWVTLQQTRKRLAQQEADEKTVEAFAKIETVASVALKNALRKHPLWPWLSQFPGLGGAHVALIIGRIGDPRRFPGQRCSEGHYLPPLYEIGSHCPVVDTMAVRDLRSVDGADETRADERRPEGERLAVCAGFMLPPRETTGVRSLWHWAGLHAVDGQAPRKRKGQQSDWEPRARASVMQPGGIAEQIVRLNVPHYADIYRATKARLILRVADGLGESARESGDAGNLLQRAPDIGGAPDPVSGRPLKLHEADRIARKVAAKAFLGDLLTAWKAISS